MVEVLLKPAGGAPIIKQQKWSLAADKPLAYIAEFIKAFKFDPHESLVRYFLGLHTSHCLFRLTGSSSWPRRWAELVLFAGGRGAGCGGV